jgi:hypothetical protein
VTGPRRIRNIERVEEDLRRGAFAALRAVFVPELLEVAPEHEFPFRTEVEVVPIEGEVGGFWHSITAFQRGRIVGVAGAERAALFVACEDLDTTVRTFANGLKCLKDRHDGKPSKF